MKKKLLLTGLFAVIILHVVAQTDVVPNFGFENWSEINGMLEPDNWTVEKITTSETDSYGTINVLGVVSSTSQANDSYTGNYALKLYSKPSFTVNYTNETLSLLGKIYSFFPISARHTTLNGYYKFTSENGDSCQFIIAMYKHGYVNPINSAYGNMVGYGSICKSTSSSYNSFSVTVNYFDASTIPDSANISISAYKQINFTTMAMLSPLGSNSELYVDKLTFDGFASGINTTTNTVKGVTLSPNPATNAFQVTEMEGIATLSLSDINGKLLLSKDVRANETVPVSTLPNGIYLVSIKSKNTMVTKKLVIQR